MFESYAITYFCKTFVSLLSLYYFSIIAGKSLTVTTQILPSVQHNKGKSLLHDFCPILKKHFSKSPSKYLNQCKCYKFKNISNTNTILDGALESLMLFQNYFCLHGKHFSSDLQWLNTFIAESFLFQTLIPRQ